MESFHSDGGDEMVNDEEVADEMKWEKLCASGSCSSMPSRQKMQIRVNTTRKLITEIVH